MVLHWDGNSWTPTPVPGIGVAEDVSADSATDAWIVGTNPAELRTEAWHGAGSTFAQVPTPSPDRRINALFRVSARRRVDAWAVGGGGSGGRTLVEHRDGTSWRRVPTPNPGGGSSLSGASAVSVTDAWAVGRANPFGDAQVPLILRWNGSTWASFQL